MSTQEKWAYLNALCERYECARRAQKSLILDEYCVTAAHSRKYAIRRLGALRRARQNESSPQGQRERSLSSRSRAAPVGNSSMPPKPPAPRKRLGRRAIYTADSALLTALSAIWRAASKPCSKRLVAALPIWLPHYEQAHCKLSKAEHALLLGISPATIDRLLRATREGEREVLRGVSGTTPASELLRGLIPVRTHHKGVAHPGWLEADTVAHCGASIAGEFYWTLNCTDIFSGWIECGAVWNKLALGVREAVSQIQRRLPFALLAFDTDNGSEFINHGLQLYLCQQHPPVDFTRSRPYEKNDQAHVEQKNNSVVRAFLGYTRFDNIALGEKLNALYAHELRDYVNFFLPTLKLVKKDYVEGKIRRRYEQIARTPHQRLISSKRGMTHQSRAQLKAHFEQLNPFTLKLQLDAKLREILNNARCTD